MIWLHHEEHIKIQNNQEKPYYLTHKRKTEKVINNNNDSQYCGQALFYVV